MTTNADGTGYCDVCEVDLPNTGVGYAVTVSGMTATGDVIGAHLCTFQPNRCAFDKLGFISVNWYSSGE